VTDYQGGKTEKNKPNAGKIALLGAGATIFAVINMYTDAEAPSRAVLIRNMPLSPAGSSRSFAG
jgi:hypothetical protein